MALLGIVSSPFSQPWLGLIQGIFLQYCFSRHRRACSTLSRFSWRLLLLLLEVLASVSSLSLSASVKPSLENIILCYIRRYRSLSVDTTMQTNVAKSFVIPPRKEGTLELPRDSTPPPPESVRSLVRWHHNQIYSGWWVTKISKEWMLRAGAPLQSRLN